MHPEEAIRQLIIDDMVGTFLFPRELIAVEKELKSLTHLQGIAVPKRRVDVIAFAKEGAEMVPLLLVECKAIPLSEKALQQVLGYNYYVNAHFVAIANAHQIVMVDRKGEKGSNGLLPYGELVMRAMGRREKSVSST